MAEDIIRILEMGDSNSDSEEKYEVYETGSDMVCVIGVENKTQPPPKNSGQKTRYKQSYREAWESMKDFKGWLTSVPGNTSKAYCKLCKKELHCHRLSLLKHKVTFKHQKKEGDLKLSNVKGEKKKTVMDQLNENTEDSNISNDSYSFDLEDENSDDGDDSVISPNSTTKEKSNDSTESKQKEKPVFEKIEKLSTHVLDTSRGEPAASVHVVLYKLIEGRWTYLLEGNTDSNGRYSFDGKGQIFTSGRYKLHFDVDRYFEEHNNHSIFPFIEVAFDALNSPDYHIPVLLSPYGYTTYKGQ